MVKRTILGVTLSSLLIITSCGQQPQVEAFIPVSEGSEARSSELSQQSLASWLITKGAKRIAKKEIKEAIELRIKRVLEDYKYDPEAKRMIEEADSILNALEDPWWVTAIGFIPVVGDVVDLSRTPYKIREALQKADVLYNRATFYSNTIRRYSSQWGRTDNFDYHWKKHASCFNMSLTEYLRKAAAFKNRLNGPNIVKTSTNTQWGPGMKYKDSITRDMMIIPNSTGKIATYADRDDSCRL